MYLPRRAAVYGTKRNRKMIEAEWMYMAGGNLPEGGKHYEERTRESAGAEEAAG